MVLAERRIATLSAYVDPGRSVVESRLSVGGQLSVTSVAAAVSKGTIHGWESPGVPKSETLVGDAGARDCPDRTETGS